MSSPVQCDDVLTLTSLAVRDQHLSVNLAGDGGRIRKFLSEKGTHYGSEESLKRDWSGISNEMRAAAEPSDAREEVGSFRRL